MPAQKPDTEELVQRAGAGDCTACEQLLVRHQHRLKRMIVVRMDARLARRVDPSDVVQDTLLEASRKLPEYLRDRPIPFYPWLRQIAQERLSHLHRRHITSQKRSLRREERGLALSDNSVRELAKRLAASGPTASGRLMQAEFREQIRATLDQLAPLDREVLVLRYLEQLSTTDTATVLGITESAVKMRHLRALQRMRDLLEED